MGHFEWEMTHRRVQLGDKGDDWFDFNIPVNETYLEALIIRASSPNVANGVNFKETPCYGATGSQRIGIHWWFDGTFIGGPGRVSYHLRVTTGVYGKVILFEHKDFEGAHNLISLPTPSLSQLDNQISSFAVLLGNWTFYKKRDYTDPFIKNNRAIVIPPGIYNWVENFGIKNDEISSLKCVLDPPNY